ncbi:cytochrome c maturation protein CcmE [Roseiterribacter gracilis]|uniref:Cytochrome c-type biogenesis protein CcmE n=1 Tax=Roseiterribacter gracilis TaxID=2812848 RepID=A0A8S8XDK9_9PROT|nr:cytochrome c-type biogenesis protein CcmE [Rhodospirillales bacterium TMPK1]
MTRKRRRLYTLLLALTGLGVATALVLTAFQDELVFFYSPTDIAANKPAPGRAIRLGGMVEQGSVQKLPDGVTKFRVTDTARTIDVTYKGALPDLFREGQGVVAEGMLAGESQFNARTILAKHDERYMPPEIAKSMKKADGEQQHSTGTLLK